MKSWKPKSGMTDFGRVTLRKNKLYFNHAQWTLVKEFARKARISPKTLVIRALKRGVKLANQKALESSQISGSRCKKDVEMVPGKTGSAKAGKSRKGSVAM